MKALARMLQRGPYFKGRDRLKRTLLSRAGTAAVEVEGLALGLDLRDAHAQHIYLNRRFPGSTWKLVRDLAQPGMTVVDVGANLGYVSLSAAKRVGPAGRVLAFEPSGRAFAQLEGNVARNSVDWVTATRLACSDHEGELELYVPDISAEYASLSRTGLRGSVTSERVEVGRLDRFLQASPDLVKVDVEGAEWDVLRGLGEFLGTPRLILEASHDNASRFGYHPNEMLDWLRDLDYGIETLQDGQVVPFSDDHVGPGGYCDVLCTPARG